MEKAFFEHALPFTAIWILKLDDCILFKLGTVSRCRWSQIVSISNIRWINELFVLLVDVFNIAVFFRACN